MQYYLGGPFWSFADWKGMFYKKNAKPGEFLEQYASVFNTVEAGSTFYANPKQDSVKKWRSQVSDDFRFVFKLPKLITHKLKLEDCQKELTDFLKLMEPVHEVTGMFQIQLSPSFSGDGFDVLKSFLEIISKDLNWAVEARHSDWFDNGENEKKLDDLLLQHSVTRMHFNTSALFKKDPITATLKESWSKKPRNPDRWSVTTPTPAIRYISCDEIMTSLKDASRLLQATAYWLEQGLTPYIFLHSPGNKITPQLCQEFHKILSRKIDLEPLPTFPIDENTQLDLF
ncbi:MAG: DUF72 domain-containing protein [Lentisphaeraceae bacterium]|nr:DUF72 domain-containing protein [Lentisphaeraceae bacterium]